MILLLPLLVEGVPFEDLLHSAAPEQDLVLLYKVRHLLVLLRRLVLHVAGVVLAVRLERRLQLAAGQLLPGKLPQPGMGLQLVRPSPAQSCFGTSLEQLIHEIGSLHRPPLRDLSLLDDSLLGHDLVLYRLPIPAQVGPFAHHEFEDDDAEGVVVDLVAMVLPGHDFGSHVPRSATSVSRVELPELLCNAQIGEVQVP